MNVTQMMSCTTTTALNSQKTSNCRGTISIVFYSHFFCYDLSNQSKGGTPSNFILCDSVAKTDTHLSTNNKPPIKSPFAAVYYCYSNSKKDTTNVCQTYTPKMGQLSLILLDIYTSYSTCSTYTTENHEFYSN